MMKPLTRGRVAKKAGIGIEALRFYERKGLIPEPPRSDSGYRLYPLQIISRLRFISRAQELGFSLKEVSDLLDLRVDPNTSCAEVKQRAQAKIADVQQKIRDLQTIRKALKKLASSCSGVGPSSECPILEELDREGAD